MILAAASASVSWQVPTTIRHCMSTESEESPYCRQMQDKMSFNRGLWGSENQFCLCPWLLPRKRLESVKSRSLGLRCHCPRVARLVQGFLRLSRSLSHMSSWRLFCLVSGFPFLWQPACILTTSSQLLTLWHQTRSPQSGPKDETPFPQKLIAALAKGTVWGFC